MSVEIKVQPQTLQPIGNPLMLVLDSPNDLEEQHQYIIDYIVASQSVSETYHQSGLDGYCSIDLSKHFEPYLSSMDFNIDNVNDDIILNENSYVKWTAAIKEQWIPNVEFTSIINSGGRPQLLVATHSFVAGNKILIQDTDIDYYVGIWNVYSVGGTTITLDGLYLSNSGSGKVRLLSQAVVTQTVSATASGVVFNGGVDWVDFIDWDHTDYTGTNSNTKLLTVLEPNDFSTAYDVDIDSRMFLSAYNNLFDYIQILYYDENRNFIVSSESDESIYIDEPEKSLLTVCVGPWNLNTGNIWGPIPATASYYEVYLIKAEFNTTYSDSYYFKINRECSKYQKWNFLFRDRMGSFLPLTTKMISKRRAEIEKSNYRQKWGSYDSSLNEWGYKSSDKGLTRLITNLTEIYTVSSDIINERMAHIFDEMLISPEVYVIDESGRLRAIDIITSAFEEKKRINDRIFDYTFEWQYSHKNNIVR